MDFLEQLKKYIETIDTFNDIVDISLLSDGNAICLRPTPSSPPSKYLNNGNLYEFNFQVLVRHSGQITAYQTKQLIALNLHRLDKGAIVSLNNSFNFIKCRMQQLPSFLEKDETGWIYSTLFKAEIYIN